MTWAVDGGGDALADADAVLAGLGKRGRKDVVVRDCSVKLKRGDDGAVEAYLVGLDGAEDDALDEHRGLELVWQRGIRPLIARRQTEHGSGIGRHRWVVERTFAWLHNRRRLLLRTDRRHETHEAFLSLAGCLICWRRLETSSS